MKLAASEGWSVVPGGAGTWLDAGNPLRSVDVIISTARLNRILDHEPADLVASTEAGVTLEDFNQTLARGGQWLPLDPPDKGLATIGGVVATGLNGAQKYGYGSPRSFVIGMRVVLADGRSAKAGGRVVKNVAGYDLCKLFTGSYGTLGVICELTFKLRPRPAREVTVVAAGALHSVFPAAWSIYKAGLFPVGIELISATMANRVAGVASPRDVQLLVRFAGIESTVDYQVEKAVAVIKGAGVSHVEIQPNDELVWRKLQAASSATGDALACRMSVKPSELNGLIETVRENFGDTSPAWHAGVGDGRLRVIQSDMSSATQSVQTLKALRAAAQSLGGSLVIENASLEIRNQIDSWENISATDLMQRVKRQLDPGDRLSPGRFGNEFLNSV